MESVLWIVGTVVVAALLYIGIRGIFSERKKTEYPRGTVILHQVGRGRYAPNMSPFPIKLETYLRFAKIPYVTIHSMKMSPKGKTPWIEFNGEVKSDSNFIIEFLNDTFQVDLNHHLSPSERAMARAFQKMAEENLYWTTAYSRWMDSRSTILTLLPQIPVVIWLVQKLARSSVKKAMYGHGLGRHSEDEIYSIAKKDIRALSVFLGDKKFLFGEEPCEEDCAIFGQLSQIVWQLSGSPQEILVKGDCKNLEDYCQRMKERFWPDWEQCIMGDQKLKNFVNVPESDPTMWKVK
ncbi:failed axon connections homolog [Glandiceps talaboti]